MYSFFSFNTLKINGKNRNLPFVISEKIEIEYIGLGIVVRSDIGVVVTYDGNTRVEVGLPPKYKDKVWGLFMVKIAKTKKYMFFQRSLWKF